jgi:hypothetical protein
MVDLILTHPGGAHKDEVLAVCVLISRFGAPVVRQEPTAEHLGDGAVAVVDIGGVHDPGSMNFDHHHFPREHPPTCALSLVLEHFGLYEDALQFCDWLEPAEWFDSRGPKKTADWLGVPRKAINQLNSPIDMTLLRRFAGKERLDPGEPLYEYMRYVGEDILEYLRLVRTRIDYAQTHAQRWSISHGDEVIEALFLPRTPTLPDEPSITAAQAVRALDLGQTVAATVYPDRRGNGYGISRYEDHPQLDFSRVEGEDDVHFAHKSGFMCKTIATDVDRLKRLIAHAWIPAHSGD